VNLLNPQLIILGGFLGSLYALNPERLHQVVSNEALAVPWSDVLISRPKLGPDLLMVGGAEIAFAALLADPAGVSGPEQDSCWRADPGRCLRDCRAGDSCMAPPLLIPRPSSTGNLLLIAAGWTCAGPRARPGDDYSQLTGSIPKYTPQKFAAQELRARRSRGGTPQKLLKTAGFAAWLLLRRERQHIRLPYSPAEPNTRTAADRTIQLRKHQQNPTAKTVVAVCCFTRLYWLVCDGHHCWGSRLTLFQNEKERPRDWTTSLRF
jgi:hypothetical protein